MMTVDEALNHAQNELESAFEKWLSDECPSGDCESVQRQWDESFVHKALVDELQPVMSLTWEVRQLREENERLRKDAERFNWIALNAKEQLSPESLHGEFAEHKTMYVLPKLIAWADFCGNIPFTEAVDYAIDAARGAK